MKNQSEFEKVGAEKRGGFIGTELLAFLVSNKKLWMAPILFIMLLFGVLIMLASTGAAPFIYTLF
ncbi:MAG: DUF5989 family protein [Verrucomicrobiales bacterium]|nr:DUF5989 family protein [Verrucomicrobiales bacterium]